MQVISNMEDFLKKMSQSFYLLFLDPRKLKLGGPGPSVRGQLSTDVIGLEILGEVNEPFTICLAEGCAL